MRFTQKILAALILAFIISGCGSATEVGNPTGELPITRTIKGTLDNVDLDLIINETGIEIESYDELTIIADGIESKSEEANMDEAGNFEMDLAISKYYEIYVNFDENVIGNFSFEQNGLGQRSNRLRINAPGEPIDFGLVRFEAGEFFPEYEPRNTGSVNMSTDTDILADEY